MQFETFEKAKKKHGINWTFKNGSTVELIAVIGYVYIVFHQNELSSCFCGSGNNAAFPGLLVETSTRIPKVSNIFFRNKRIQNNITLTKTNIVPENRPSQKGNQSSNYPFSGALAVSFREGIYIYIYLSNYAFSRYRVVNQILTKLLNGPSVSGPGGPSETNWFIFSLIVTWEALCGGLKSRRTDHRNFRGSMMGLKDSMHFCFQKKLASDGQQDYRVNQPKWYGKWLGGAPTKHNKTLSTCAA